MFDPWIEMSFSLIKPQLEESKLKLNMIFLRRDVSHMTAESLS